MGEQRIASAQRGADVPAHRLLPIRTAAWSFSTLSWLTLPMVTSST
jgi:hypothetical protein